MVKLTKKQLASLLAILSRSPTDAVKLAFLPRDTPMDLFDKMDFTGLSSYKRQGDSVEVKLIDRIAGLSSIIEVQRAYPDDAMSKLIAALAPEIRENDDVEAE